ncbi:hypothetical protein [Sporosarcina sp. NPDC096371]|uniref:hypothetical protein n=1 Tax=Sporosarcina sp. NPDC096371 TaxID=3364530 RepID=UPI0038127466
MRQIRYMYPFCLLVFLLFFLKPIPAAACSCAAIPSPEEGFSNAQVVFSGEVIKVKDNNGFLGNYGKTVLFAVNETWKGTNETEIEITTGYGGGDCGVAFIVGQSYLVYANLSDMYKRKSLSTTICSPTKALGDASEDLTILGKGQVPTHVTSPIYSEKPTYLIIGGFVFIAGLLAVFGWMRFKKGKS